MRVTLSTAGTTVDGKSKVVFTVADSGKGISREFLKTKLFTPFSQENPLSAGAGLGLSLVRQLIGVIGGKIDIKSQLGVGTTVDVEMTVTAGSCSGESGIVNGLDTDLKARVQGRKVRIFGFDDVATPSAAQQKGIQLLKQSLIGYAVEYYAMELVDIPGSEDVLIVPDINTPGIEETLRSRRVPVITLCIRPPIPGSTEEEAALQKGLVTFLRKPFGPKRFTEGLRDAVELSERARTAPPPPPPTTMSSSPQPVPPIKSVSPPSTASSMPPPPTPSTPSRSHLSPLCKNPDYTKPTVLAVEDNAINMRLLTAYLTKTRYPFSTAMDGLEALNLVKSVRESGGKGFDVILMDLRKFLPSCFLLSLAWPVMLTSLIEMPVLSGTESTREIRALEAADEKLDDSAPCKLKRSYIVALTGLAAAKDRQEALIAGVDAFVVKPAKFRELERMWLEFLGKGK